MVLKRIFAFRTKSALAALLLTLAFPLFGQVVPSATAAGRPFSAGGGFSNYDVDWAHGRMDGATIWIDWHGELGPAFLHGLGIEAEARDIRFGGSSSQPTNLRYDTAGGGLIYSYRRYRNFRPYVKAIVSQGSLDFQIGDPYYTHDTRIVYAPGGGVDYRIFGHVWARADYEYQVWPDLFRKQNALDPQGFTVGALYNFGSFRRH